MLLNMKNTYILFFVNFLNPLYQFVIQFCKNTFLGFAKKRINILKKVKRVGC